MEQTKLLANAFIDSRVNYASLIWLFCHCKIHHKMLRIIHQSNTTSYDWLECSGSTPIHQRHLQFLLTKIYKSTATADLRFMLYFFRDSDVPYNLKKVAILFLLLARSTTHESNFAHFCGTLIRNQLPSFIRSSKSFIQFKTNVKWEILTVVLLYVGNSFSFLYLLLLLLLLLWHFPLMNIFVFVSWFLLAFAQIVPT